MAKRAPMTLDKAFGELTAKKPGNGPPAPPPAAVPQEASKSDGRKGQTLRLSVEAWRQLKQTALDEGVTAHTLLIEAVNDWFRKRGKPPIA